MSSARHYTAVGIQSDIWTPFKKSDFQRNLDSLVFNIGRAVRYAEQELPVRLVALNEGAITGWATLAAGEEHLRAYREWAPNLDGPEVRILADLCRDGNFYLMGQMQAKAPELAENLIFNRGFVIDPNGNTILTYQKSAIAHLVETMAEPMDIWERYLELYGDDPQKLMDAVYPVAKTEIGNLGISICAAGSFPEEIRGLALNGAEVIWHPNYVEPYLSNGVVEAWNRAHAVNNRAYIIANCSSEVYGYRVPGENKGEISRDHKVSWGQSRMYDYNGLEMSCCMGTGQSFVAGTINIDGLRDYRVRSLWGNFTKELRIEQNKAIYDAILARGGLYQKNLLMDGPPLTTAEYKELARYHVNRAVEAGVYTAPDGWVPYKIGGNVLDRIQKAQKH